MSGGPRTPAATGGRGAALAETWALVAGVTRRPVETYEKIARTPSPRGAVIFIGLLSLIPAAVMAAIEAVATGPVAAVAAFVAWAAVGVFGVYLAASAVIWLVGRLLGSRGSFEAVLTAWAGSYVPTAVWFGGLLLTHVLFAPPGFIDVRPAGAGPGPSLAVQVVFLAFSVAVFLWKALLLYLTLRVVGGLDFRRIVAAAAILAPVAVGYWFVGSYLDWFKVPFI